MRWRENLCILTATDLAATFKKNKISYPQTKEMMTVELSLK